MPKCGLPLSLSLAALATVAFATGARVATAQAPVRVAVERFRGPQSGSMRSALIADLEREGIELVPDEEVRAKAREIFGRTALGDDDYPEVARALDIVAFVDGRVSRQRRRWGLRVRVRNGADGMLLGTARWGGRTVGALRAVRRNGHAKIAEYLALASSPAPVPVQAAGAEPTVAGPDASPWYATEGEAPPSAEGDDGDEGPSDVEGRPHDAFRARLLLGSLKRSLSTEVQVDSTFRPPLADTGGLLIEERAYPSSGLGHMEVGVAVELFPGALLEDPVVPWLGLAFHFRNSALLATTGNACIQEEEPAGGRTDCLRGTSADPEVDVDVDTVQREVYVGAKVEYGFGGTAGGPWIDVDLGYGRFLFDLDADDLALLRRPQIVPSMAYSYLHLGLGVRLGLHEMVMLGARAAYRQGFGAGDDARRIWGTETDGFRGWIVGADLIHTMRWASDNLFATLSVEYFRFTTDFRGPPACRAPDPGSDCLAGELWEPWFGESDGFIDPVSDSYLRLSLGLGLVY